MAVTTRPDMFRVNVKEWVCEWRDKKDKREKREKAEERSNTKEIEDRGRGDRENTNTRGKACMHASGLRTMAHDTRYKES